MLCYSAEAYRSAHEKDRAASMRSLSSIFTNPNRHVTPEQKARLKARRAELKILEDKAFAAAVPYTPKGMPSWYTVMPELDLSFVKVPQHRLNCIAAMPYFEKLLADKKIELGGERDVFYPGYWPENEEEGCPMDESSSDLVSLTVEEQVGASEEQLSMDETLTTHVALPVEKEVSRYETSSKLISSPIHEDHSASEDEKSIYQVFSEVDSSDEDKSVHAAYSDIDSSDDEQSVNSPPPPARKSTKKAARPATKAPRRKSNKKATRAAPAAPRKKTQKSGTWDTFEHNCIEIELRSLRNEERLCGLVGTQGLRDINLWTYISNQLADLGITRSQSACKNYWSRYGRARSYFDERAIPIPHQLATSLQ